MHDVQSKTFKFSDREYQCLGQWEEGDTLFTVTRRHDVNVVECFVGVADDKKGLFLMESGTNCRRGLSVSQYGMQLTKKSKSDIWHKVVAVVAEVIAVGAVIIVEAVVTFEAENTKLTGGITVQLTSSLFCLDSAVLVMLNEQQFYLPRAIKAHLHTSISSYLDGEMSQRYTGLQPSASDLQLFNPR